MSSNTKKNIRSNIYLIGSEISQIFGAKLPSNKQVLSVFFYNHNIVKLTIRESARLAIREVSIFWSKAKIPIRDEQRCIDKLENLHKTWVAIGKNKNKRTEAQRNKERAFTEKLNDLFDIAHANALNMIKWEEDKQFLIAQRQKGRQGSMAGVDMKSLQKAKRKAERLTAEEARRNRVTNCADVALNSSQGITLLLSFFYIIIISLYFLYS